MATLKELRNSRLEKLNALKKKGIDPYPARSTKNITNAEITANFEELESKDVVVAGRALSIREHGKLAFIDLKDHTGKVQLYIKSDSLNSANYDQSELNFKDLQLLDAGDFVEARGTVTKPKRGEISIEVYKLRLLTKTIRPLPDMWEGLKDKETRLRRRYLDTTINDDVYRRFERRAKFWEVHRDFFKSNGFLEMNIPVLESVTGGADANPFVTHMDSINQDFYLRISQELFLKRLIGGGYPKVYEIGPRFRNEGLSDEHLPEHIAMEFYWAYADYNEGRKFIEELYRSIIKNVYGKEQFNIRGFDVDFSKDWDLMDFTQIIKERFGINVFTTNLDEIKNLLVKNKVKVEPGLNIPRGIDTLWKIIRKTIAGPVFLVNVPKFLSPLAKSNPDVPEITERFQPIIAGSELGNGWSELNDPLDQLERFMEQQRMRDAGDAEAQMLDIDFVEMLEYGMPPTFGYGHTERVFWFLEDVPAREGVPFPQLRHEVDDVTKSIYPEIYSHEDEGNSEVHEGKDFAISSKLRKEIPSISAGFAIIKGVKIEKENPELEAEKSELLKSLENLTNADIDSFPEIQSYRKLYKTMGVDWHSRRPSPEALLRRIAQKKGLYTINTCVDAYNTVVIRNHVSIGAFDYNKVVFPTMLRYANEGDEITLIGEDKPTKISAREICYFDDKGAFNLDFNYRDSDRTKVTLETTDLMINVDGVNDISKEQVAQVLDETIAIILKYCGGEVVEKYVA